MGWLTWWNLTFSFFNTICLLWLGLMVWLIGNRRSPGVWLTGGGLLLGALFFTSHTAILGRGLGNVSFGMNFWWSVSWAPAVAAPLAWYCALLWYAGQGGRLAWSGRPLGLPLMLGLAALIVLLLAFANPLPTYSSVAGRALALTPSIGGIPDLVLAYLVYSLLAYLLPLHFLQPILHPSRKPTARGDDLATPGVVGMARAARVHRRAQPWLSGASLALLLAGGVLAWAALWALTTHPLPSLADPAAQWAVMRFDLAVQALVAVAITLLGRAVVGFEVFTGRAMPSGRFFSHWRSTLLLAAALGAGAAFSLVIDLRPIYSLMLSLLMMTVFYALYTWRSFREREDFMARLRPFIASQDLYSRLTGAALRPPVNQPLSPQLSQNLSHHQQFTSLCADLLEVRAALLLPTGALAALAGPGLVYPLDSVIPVPEQLAALSARLQSAPPSAWSIAQQDVPAPYEWAVPLWAQNSALPRSPRRLCGLLLLAEKTNRAPLTEEEMQVAQAAGERLVDSLAATEMTRLALDLLAQRLSQARVLEGQGRRALHDEVLPELHTAILDLSQLVTTPVVPEADDTPLTQRPLSQPSLSQRPLPPAEQAMQRLVNVHRRIADLMRELPLASPPRLADEGLPAALQDLLAGGLTGRFERVDWQIDSNAAARAREIPLFSLEVLFFAARELLRNAAQHGRGDQPNRALTVWIALRLEDDTLLLSIADDGVGLGYPSAVRAAAPGGAGLRIHTALLAAMGSSLELSARPAGGVQAQIVCPMK